ncbi:hypothetical protein LTR48_002585 [Friedmanniomyces endolithicus]|uniref:DUF2231 domain-containing protein n=1 Tax=Rachicladosporium monterosium TaxID=1507873 RepID=A0ABR0LAJ8_9PEZI|nr:hypothetical protein LTR29_005069 [Friedmanniomyces endolithicus]KAK1093312.1 hypothetical protein LTR48_002585 [Friedmanniomyces endolithicus]KAK5145937.1 hypothetical protein LTR32_002400 [Rachicladosporium monterosium]
MGIFSDLYSTVELGHFQWPFRNSHPVHPATVHHPLAFLSTAYTLDTVFGLTSYYSSVRTFAAITPFLPQIAQLAFLSHALGVVTAIPSMTSGTAEWYEIYRSDGLNRRDKKLTHPGTSGDEIVKSSIAVGAVHGMLNAVAFAVSGYAVWSRMSRRPTFTPGRTGIWLSALTLPGVAVSAALGGELVYGKGIGVQRMGAARDEKVAGIKEIERAKRM